MSSEEKRQELKAKILAADTRNAERTMADSVKDAADSATTFVKAHPVATVAGVVAVGLAIGAMTRPGRKAGKRAGQKASSLASYAAEMGAAYAVGLFDAANGAAQDGRKKVADLSDNLGDNFSDRASALKQRATLLNKENIIVAARALLSRGAGKNN